MISPFRASSHPGPVASRVRARPVFRGEVAISPKGLCLASPPP